MTRRKIEYWVIPPEADAEFVASMEEVLDVYARPYDSRYPVLCMDEQPMQLLKETRKPIAAPKSTRVGWTTNTSERERRAFSCFANRCLAGDKCRCASDERRSTGRRKSRTLLRTRYASAEKVILVCDNLNTHTKGAFYEAFEPTEREIAGAPIGVLSHAQARQLVEHRRKRVEFDDPAVHNWPSFCDG